MWKKKNKSIIILDARIQRAEIDEKEITCKIFFGAIFIN